jgi:hypothetical protein
MPFKKISVIKIIIERWQEVMLLLIKYEVLESTLKIVFIGRKENWIWAPVAHACNLSYSGGRDNEDCGSKSAQSQNPITKRAAGVTKVIDPEFKPQYCPPQKKKKGKLGYLCFRERH